MRKALLSEKNLVVVLFVLVVVIFTLAQQDTKIIQQQYVDPAALYTPNISLDQPNTKATTDHPSTPTAELR